MRSSVFAKYNTPSETSVPVSVDGKRCRITNKHDDKNEIENKSNLENIFLHRGNVSPYKGLI